MNFTGHPHDNNDIASPTSLRNAMEEKDTAWVQADRSIKTGFPEEHTHTKISASKFHSGEGKLIKTSRSSVACLRILAPFFLSKADTRDFCVFFSPKFLISVCTTQKRKKKEKKEKKRKKKKKKREKK